MSKSDLTVVCQLWGSWGEPMQAEYVARLKAGVERHFSAPHRFICMTDTPSRVPEGVEMLPLGCKGWRWNLRKMALYAPENGLSGRILALDLDTIITGSLDDIASYRGRFAVLEDFYDKGRCGGGVISFEAGTLSDDLYWPIVLDRFKVNALTRGSERKWYRAQMPGADFWQTMFPGQIVSFKPKPSEMLSAVPDDARMVCFHGSPRPHESDVGWLNNFWR